LEKQTKTKTQEQSGDITSSTKNLFLNVAIFLLFAVIVFMLYSIYLKITGFKQEYTSTTISQTPSEIIQVEVLNGCGISGVADRFTDYLRNNQFDVVNMGNYIRFDMDETLVIDRIGNMANAQKTAKALGVKNSNILQQLNQEYFLDVSIVIGRDYYTLQPFK